MITATATEGGSDGVGPVRPLLRVEGLEASYGPVQVLRGLDFEVGAGEVVVILGANGAGKTTTLRAVCNMIATKGRIELDGEDVSKRSTAEIVRRGLAHVPQGRGTFPELSVVDNLEAGAYVRKDRKDIQPDIERWYEMFPRLHERRNQLAGSLSGGEQQMLAVARALMSRPKVLLLDEPSLGLAPLIVQGLFQRLAELNRTEGMTMLVVEQNANLALQIADRGYVIETGKIVLSGRAADLQQDEGVRRAYLGF